MRLNVPARIPDVSANASFCTLKERKKNVVNQSVSHRYEDVKRMCRRRRRRRRRAPIRRCTQTMTAWEGERKQRTHHLTELDGRLAYLIPNPNRDLKDGKRARSSITHASRLEPEERKKKKKRGGGVHSHTPTSPNHAARSRPRW
jgi:hypothetical protein